MSSVEFSQEIENRLNHLVKVTGRSKADYHQAILQYIEDLEDTYLALERLQNPGRRWTIEEIRKGRDLVDD
ncbi:MAG: CopG family transcriptional regulator [Rhizonema sp. PD37]|nr:CopG family transcriptional regulator [Rhizonema sp. PD37]